MPQYETTTQGLVGIIHSIKLEQKSGMLRARRGEGTMQEEGTIVFVNGRMTQASAGRRIGMAALNWLCTWGSCHYMFISSAREVEQSDIFSSASSNEDLLTQTDRLTGTQHADTGPMGRMPVSLPVTPVPFPQAYEANNGARAAPDEYHIVPRSTSSLQDTLRLIEHYQLSRSHRQLFLLINGQRSLKELMHLVGKEREEILALLHDLESLGVIHIGGN